MFENITTIDLKVLSLYTRDYSATFSIRHITKSLNINYSHAFKRVKKLVKDGILLEKKTGQVNNLSLNIKNLDTIQLLSFAEERESKKIKYSALMLIAEEAAKIDPFSCIGLFGSRVAGKAIKESDWDMFIITQKSRKREVERLMSKFPFARNIQLQVFSLDEFEESLLSPEETVVKHIVRNKQIIYNPYPFYNIISKWEKVKYAPSQTS
jgi:predicted nucleotidyltransferase